MVMMNLTIFSAEEPVKYFKNYDLDEIVTPVNCDKLQQLLEQCNFDPVEKDYLCDGFRNGFDLGYCGPINRKDSSQNLPFTVGNPMELWNKVMNEVEVGCYAGPFKEISYHNFVQSPIGLVPKAGNKTRLIFHLSYDFKMEINP